MFDQGHNRLQAFVSDLESAMRQQIEADRFFFDALRPVAEKVAKDYPEFFLINPEKIGNAAVAEIWDAQWQKVATPEVPITPEMANTKCW